jgi:hypothetical protein
VLSATGHLHGVAQNARSCSHPDNFNCDSHLINEGISVTGSSGVIMFEATGPTAASPVTNFDCSVTNSMTGTPVNNQTNVPCKCMYVVTLVHGCPMVYTCKQACKEQHLATGTAWSTASRRP